MEGDSPDFATLDTRQMALKGGLQTGGSGRLLTSRSVQDYLIYVMQIFTLSLHYGLSSLLLISANCSCGCE